VQLESNISAKRYRIFIGYVWFICNVCQRFSIGLVADFKRIISEVKLELATNYRRCCIQLFFNILFLRSIQSSDLLKNSFSEGINFSKIFTEFRLLVSTSAVIFFVFIFSKPNEISPLVISVPNPFLQLFYFYHYKILNNLISNNSEV
jgi:hypothetical protein